MHEVGWFGGKIVKKLGKAAKKVGKVAGKAVSTAAPIAQQVIKSTPLGATPLGMAAGGALGVMRGVVRGDRLENIAWSAAEGATPAGLDRAVRAAKALRQGQPILKVALSEARSAIANGTPAASGFDQASRLLASGAAPGAIAAARKALGNEVARRGFDAAVGTLSRAAQKVPARALKSADIVKLARKPTRMLSAVRPNVALARAALARAPRLAASSPATAARELGLPIRAVQDAMRIMKPSGMKWRPLSRRGAAFIKRYTAVPARALTLTSDTTGLVAGTTSYIIENGDLPYKIAQKFSGNANGWHQLPAVNTQLKMKEVQKKDSKGKIIFSGLTPFYAGLKINLPPAWFGGGVAPTVPGVPTPTPTAPTPAPQPSELNAAAVLQAKGTLAAWSKTDGAASAGVTNYGLSLEDMTPAWTARDKLMLISFSNWWNKGGKSPSLSSGGELTNAHGDALRAWAEGKAAQTTPTAPAQPTPAPSTPTIPGVTPPGGTTPGEPTPAPTPFPQFPTIPIPSIPGVTPPGGTAPSAPSVPSVPSPFPPSPSPAQPDAKKDDSDGFGMLALVGALAAVFA